MLGRVNKEAVRGGGKGDLLKSIGSLALLLTSVTVGSMQHVARALDYLDL